MSSGRTPRRTPSWAARSTVSPTRARIISGLCRRLGRQCRGRRPSLLLCCPEGANSPRTPLASACHEASDLGPIHSGIYLRRETLDSVATRIRNGEIASRIQRHSGGIVELTWPVAVGCPLSNRSSRRRQLLNAIVPRVRDVDVPVRINGQPFRFPKSARPAEVRRRWDPGRRPSPARVSASIMRPLCLASARSVFLRTHVSHHISYVWSLPWV